jgi:hypothetical protein
MDNQDNNELSLDSVHLIHLNWMFENQPDLVRQLHQSGNLLEHLDDQIQPALRRVEELQRERGLTWDEALEVAASEHLCPPDGPASQPNPPEPVPLEEQEKIIESL